MAAFTSDEAGDLPDCSTRAAATALGSLVQKISPRRRKTNIVRMCSRSDNYDCACGATTLTIPSLLCFVDPEELPVPYYIHAYTKSYSMLMSSDHTSYRHA
jgi:hypothetical protein